VSAYAAPRKHGPIHDDALRPGRDAGRSSQPLARRIDCHALDIRADDRDPRRGAIGADMLRARDDDAGGLSVDRRRLGQHHRVGADGGERLLLRGAYSA
jgi:hypothetical protein